MQTWNRGIMGPEADQDQFPLLVRNRAGSGETCVLVPAPLVLQFLRWSLDKKDPGKRAIAQVSHFLRECFTHQFIAHKSVAFFCSGWI